MVWFGLYGTFKVFMVYTLLVIPSSSIEYPGTRFLAIFRAFKYSGNWVEQSSTYSKYEFSSVLAVSIQIFKIKKLNLKLLEIESF